MNDTVLVEVTESHVGILTLNRPEQLNTFNSQMAGELHAALLAMEADSSVRVILLKSSGRAFCAGIDVNELAGKSAIQYREWIEWMENPLVVTTLHHRRCKGRGYGLFGKTKSAVDLALEAYASPVIGSYARRALRTISLFSSRSHSTELATAAHSCQS